MRRRYEGCRPMRGRHNAKLPTPQGKPLNIKNEWMCHTVGIVSKAELRQRAISTGRDVDPVKLANETGYDMPRDKPVGNDDT